MAGAISRQSRDSHHTNPVGTEWKWKMDDAETILNGVMSQHYDMLKQFRGAMQSAVPLLLTHTQACPERCRSA